MEAGRTRLEQPFTYGEGVNEEVLHQLGSIRGRLLDVGSGAGSWAPRLRAAGGSHLVALDPSAAALEQARLRYDLAVLGGVEDVDLDRLGAEPFDVIVVADVLEHLVDPWSALRKLRRWASADGLLAVSVPNLRYYRLIGNLAFRGEFEYERAGVRDWTHLRWFTQRSLGRALVSCGWLPLRWGRSRTLKGRLLARVSEQVANECLRAQLTVVARVSTEPPAPQR